MATFDWARYAEEAMKGVKEQMEAALKSEAEKEKYKFNKNTNTEKKENKTKYTVNLKSASELYEELNGYKFDPSKDFDFKKKEFKKKSEYAEYEVVESRLNGREIEFPHILEPVGLYQDIMNQYVISNCKPYYIF